MQKHAKFNAGFSVAVGKILLIQNFFNSKWKLRAYQSEFSRTVYRHYE